MSTIEITRHNLEATVLANGIVLLDFWASWCGPCLVFGPVFEQAAAEHADVVFGKIDTEAEQELAAMFGITSVPTVMAFRDGINVFSRAGSLPASALRQLVKTIRGLDMDDVRAKLAQEEPASVPTSTPD